MVSANDRMIETLRLNKKSVTSARIAVFEILENNEPLSMHELCKKLDSKIDRASVYRTIDVFEKLHIVQRLSFGWKYKLELSNEFQEHHHHMSCQKCGKILSFHEDKKLETLVAEIADTHKFMMIGHQIELHGICRNCQ